MIFTSEQVSEGHPDKICDQISDAILTEALKQDKKSKVAIEALIKDEHIIIAGELTTEALIDYEKVTKEVLRGIGLEDVDSYNITQYINKQSPDIAQGVDTGGAGDQGMMFGYATNETKELLPTPYVLATKALLYLKELKNPLLKPDAKAQVSFDYTNNKIDTFLISTQHTEEATNEELHKVVKGVMLRVAADYGYNEDFKVLINPTGRFVIGSSFGDTGLTGRKIIADTYGGVARHGGGAFSGKDPSKVDRSGAYIARKIAVDIVKLGFTDKVEVQLAYAIGVAKPVSILINCFGTNKVPESEIESYILREYDLTPSGIIERLDLLNIDYTKTSTYGHFGKNYLTWEQ